MKQRKQMRIYDLYRLAITGRTSEIRGIRQYQCNDGVTRVCISFDDDEFGPWYFRCKDEQDHKNLIRCVNKMIYFINAGRCDIALCAYNDYNREYHRRWADESKDDPEEV